MDEGFDKRLMDFAEDYRRQYEAGRIRGPDGNLCCNEPIPVGDDLESTIQFSVRSKCENGKIHSHQRRVFWFWCDAFPKLENRLMSQTVRIGESRSFDELHDLVEFEGKYVTGCGPLFIYDVSVRIGRYLELVPEFVYLHCGAMEGLRFSVSVN